MKGKFVVKLDLREANTMRRALVLAKTNALNCAREANEKDDHETGEELASAAAEYSAVLARF